MAPFSKLPFEFPTIICLTPNEDQLKLDQAAILEKCYVTLAKIVQIH